MRIIRAPGVVARPLLSLAVVVLASCMGGAGADPPPDPSKRGPNILLIVTDDQRGGLDDVLQKTRAWLVDGGVRYRRAYVATPLCCPSRASIWTGRYAHNHGVRNNLQAQNLNTSTTIQHYLHRAGYRTGLLGKLYNSWPLDRNPPDFDTWAFFSSSQTAYSGGNWNVQGSVRRITQYATHFLGDQAEAFLSSDRANSPWFLYIGPPSPHEPYILEDRYRNAPVPAWTGNDAVFESDKSDKPPYVQRRNASYEEGNAHRVAQMRTLMSVDDLVDRVMRVLQSTGQLDDTLVIFTSDNGVMWAEHGLLQKSHAYTETLKVPLLLRWPGHVRPGKIDPRLVVNVDIAPTILQAAEVTPTTPMDGRSLLTGAPRTRILIEYFKNGDAPIPPWAMTRTPTAQYTEYYDPSTGAVTFREYYDLVEDPSQLENLRTPPAGWAERLAADRQCRGATCP